MNNEWIGFTGDVCPVPGETRVDVIFADLARLTGQAGEFVWQRGRTNSVIQYRLAETGIGDVNSTERGSGARLNAGKVPLDLIPLTILSDSFRPSAGWHYELLTAFSAIARFQEGGDESDLYSAIHTLDRMPTKYGENAWDGCHGDGWIECAKVFDYGRKKYAEWNWAKGMPWSVPIACAARHLFLGMLNGEELDPESRLPHRGHVICNLVMLITYVKTYPEGDDRPKGLI